MLARFEGATWNLSGAYGKTEVLPELWLCGQVFSCEQALAAADLLPLLTLACQQNQLPEYLRSLNGFFSGVLLLDGQLFCFTDRTRSRPLFYGMDGAELLISDDTGWLLERLPAAEPEPDSVAEFSFTGFITGSATLHPGIYQLQAAELLQWSLGQPPQRIIYDWYLHLNSQNTPESIQPWLEQLDQVTEKVVQRLIRYANGRQIVLPLSGGYDSRALAMHFRRAGYPDVVCFTFGRPGSAEVALSRKVASLAGYPWVCVTYSRQMWRELFQQPEFQRFLDFVHGLVSVPTVQVFPAIQQLVKNRQIDANAVIAPGHTGAFFSGALDDSGWCESHQVPKALNAVLKKHYEHSREALPEAVREKIVLQLETIADEARRRQRLNVNSLAECWNYRERQAKFIINSNRYYDFFALDWWMPLWDGDFMAFWQQVPYSLRRSKLLWKTYVNQLVSQQSGNAEPLGHANVKRYPWLTRLYSWFNYFLEDNHLYAIVPFKRWLAFKLRLSQERGTVFGTLAGYMVFRDKLRFDIKNTKSRKNMSKNAAM
ncbi:hypothetical protein ACFO3I_17650 [Rheinheimera marina]|uniref:asparagine synthase (glutamine-hydrolyzing) n=1 Tax=Rheinheimera marina TaxID=1774958 RepID=A0ABV9JRF9_9GAMM